MNLLSPNVLAKLRRGAEQLFRKHRDSLADKRITVKATIAKELGIPHNTADTSPVAVSNGLDQSKAGLFPDEPKAKMVAPTAMASVLLSDYIAALKKYGDGPKAAPATPPKK